MENSSEYKQFLSFLNASTREKMDEYKLNIFEILIMNQTLN